VDASKLAQVEQEYGSKAFDEVLSRISKMVGELRGSEVRGGDLLALSDRGGNAFLLFLAPRRTSPEDRRSRLADLEAAARRVEDHLNGRLAEFPSPYLRGRRDVSVGFAVAFHNPLINPERVIARLVEEAEESVRIYQMQTEFQTRCRLQDILLAEEIRTVFQPIVELKTGAALGFEALSRGPAGTAQHNPMNLFEAADAIDLTFELDRHCRRRAMRTARNLPAPFRLFINSRRTGSCWR
jgi:hypothetical protein